MSALFCALAIKVSSKCELQQLATHTFRKAILVEPLHLLIRFGLAVWGMTWSRVASTSLGIGGVDMPKHRENEIKSVCDVSRMIL